MVEWFAERKLINVRVAFTLFTSPGSVLIFLTSFSLSEDPLPPLGLFFLLLEDEL